MVGANQEWAIKLSVLEIALQIFPLCSQSLLSGGECHTRLQEGEDEETVRIAFLRLLPVRRDGWLKDIPGEASYNSNIVSMAIRSHINQVLEPN